MHGQISCTAYFVFDFLLLAVTSMMSAPPASGSRRIDSRAGTIAVTVCMVITAVIATVMGMTPFLSAAFHGADRAAGIGCRYCLPVMMSVSRDRGNKEDGYQHDCRGGAEQFSE